MRVAVVGAGIVGASVAFRLARGGVRVWLLDESHPASGTTSSSFAWVNANSKTPREYFELNRAGMEEHLRLGDEMPGGAPWLHAGGNLIWVEDTNLEELVHRVERLRSWGYVAEWRQASQVNEHLEPRLEFTAPDAPVAFFPEEAWIDAPQLTRTLVRLAARNGAETRFGSAVESIETEGGRVFGVWVAGGEELRVDAVVNAAGPGAARVAAMAGRKLPLVSRSGLLARVAVAGEPLHRVFHSPRINLRPDGPGHVLLHQPSVDERLGGEDVSPLSCELLDRAREVLPALKNARLVEERIGVRPIPEDGLPCVGAVSNIPGYYEAVTHSGVTLGPLIGRLLAREIIEGDEPPLLATFRPDRYAR